jgi:RNA polymerase sigma-70 factor (ECF subfamily)
MSHRQRPEAVADQVRSFQRGDAGAAEWLALRACRLALQTSGAILRDREEAGDVAQDVAVDVLRSLGRLRDPEAFDAWVHRITVRHASRALGVRRSRARLERALDGIEDAAEPRAEAHDLDLVLAARDALTGGLAKLPAKQRLALALRYVHDLSDDEIAAALDCRPGTVHGLLSRGRAALRRDKAVDRLTDAMAGG